MSIFAETSPFATLKDSFVHHEITGDSLHSEMQLSFSDLKEQRGDLYYQDLLESLFRKDFSGKDCKLLWQSIVSHKEEMQLALNRKVHIVVAGLDYFDLHSNDLKDIILMDRKSHDRILQHTLKDELTKLYNFSFFKSTLPKEVERYTRTDSPLCLLMLDLDHFKAYNDEHGHLQGNILLERVGELLLKLTRRYDSPVRYGGDEFAIIAPNTTTSQGFALAKRIVDGFKQELYLEFNVSVSIGLAVTSKEINTAEKLLEAADEKLYISKETRNFKISGL